MERQPLTPDPGIPTPENKKRHWILIWDGEIILASLSLCLILAGLYIIYVIGDFEFGNTLYQSGNYSATFVCLIYLIRKGKLIRTGLWRWIAIFGLSIPVALILRIQWPGATIMIEVAAVCIYLLYAYSFRWRKPLLLNDILKLSWATMAFVVTPFFTYDRQHRWYLFMVMTALLLWMTARVFHAKMRRLSR